MRLVSAKAGSQSFPDGTKSSHVVLTFEQDGELVHKRANISSCAAAVSRELKTEAQRLILKVAREAVRDFAFKKYGPEKWREHVTWGRFFSEERTPEEQALIDDAVALLCRQVH